MSGLLGQGDAFDRALTAARALRLPHGLVIEGVPGGGKSTAARLLAQALLCGGDAGTLIEGSCTCSKRVANGQHPDLHLVELPEDRQDIPVEVVRELQATLERMPVEGRARVAILDPADRLNEQGQNALLKTLEEPGADTFLLLVTSRPEALLETVRSRAQRLRVLPLDDDALRAALGPAAAVDPAERALAIAGAGGSLGVARALIEPSARALATIVATFLATPAPTALGDARALLDDVTGRTETEHRLRSVLASLRAQLRTALRGSLGVVENSPDGYPPPSAEPWVSALEATFDAEQDFASGIPASQVLDGLLLRLVDLLGGATSSP